MGIHFLTFQYSLSWMPGRSQQTSHPVLSGKPQDKKRELNNAIVARFYQVITVWSYLLQRCGEKWTKGCEIANKRCSVQGISGDPSQACEFHFLLQESSHGPHLKILPLFQPLDAWSLILLRHLISLSHETPFIYFLSYYSQMTHCFGNTDMMVNFICQFDWATGCSDIWLNIILGFSLWGCFWMRLAFESEDRIKQIVLPKAGEHQIILLRA